MTTLLQVDVVYNSMTSNLSCIESTVIYVMNQFIPQAKIHSHQQPKWFTPKIRHHIKCLHTLHHKHQCHLTEHYVRALHHSALGNSFKCFPKLKQIMNQNLLQVCMLFIMHLLSTTTSKT